MCNDVLYICKQERITTINLKLTETNDRTAPICDEHYMQKQNVITLQIHIHLYIYIFKYKCIHITIYKSPLSIYTTCMQV